MENLTMLRFMLSQPSIERRSAMRFWISAGSSVGMAMPGTGTPSGPQSRRKSSKGSCGGGWSGMDATFAVVEELAHLGIAPHGVVVAEVDQRAAERLLEQQVARKVRARAVEGAGRSQDETHGGRQLVHEARCDSLEGLRRRDEQHLHRPQLRVLERLGWNECERAIDPFEALDVDHQAVEEDAVQRVPGDLRERRVDVRAGARLIDALASGTDDQHTVRPEVQRWAHRRDLTHRAVAEVLAVQLHRGEDKRQRRRGEQVLHLQGDRRPDALVALPALQTAAALEEGHALAGGVARGGYAHGVERAGVEVQPDFFGRDILFQEGAQGRVVEKGHRVAPRHEHRGGEPACAALHDAPGVGAIDVVAVHALPERKEPRHRAGEVICRGGEACYVDGAGRGPGEDWKRVARGSAEDVAHRLEHARLVGGARAAAGEHQPRPRLHPARREGRDVAGGGLHYSSVCSWPRGALASATASAVMLTMRRTVAEGVRMCTGRAAPSRIGPTVTPPPAAVLRRLNEMLAASSVGMMSRFASPRSLEFGNTRRRIASDSAASPCISPSISSSGARCAISSRAWRILAAEPVLSEPKFDAESSAAFGTMPKRLISSAASSVISAIWSASGSGFT